MLYPQYNPDGTYVINPTEIPHTYKEIFDGWQICYPQTDGLIMDAIQHFGSYGGDNNKLEIQGLLTDSKAEIDSVLGWLTAENVFNRIEKHYSKFKRTLPTNCPNCGAVLFDGKCEYCNAQVQRLDIGKLLEF